MLTKLKAVEKSEKIKTYCRPRFLARKRHTVSQKWTVLRDGIYEKSPWNWSKTELEVCISWKLHSVCFLIDEEKKRIGEDLGLDWDPVSLKERIDWGHLYTVRERAREQRKIENSVGRIWCSFWGGSELGKRPKIYDKRRCSGTKTKNCFVGMLIFSPVAEELWSMKWKPGCE